jgi:hypothetical protein
MTMMTMMMTSMMRKRKMMRRVTITMRVDSSGSAQPSWRRVDFLLFRSG